MEGSSRDCEWHGTYTAGWCCLACAIHMLSSAGRDVLVALVGWRSTLSVGTSWPQSIYPARISWNGGLSWRTHAYEQIDLHAQSHIRASPWINLLRPLTTPVRPPALRSLSRSRPRTHPRAKGEMILQITRSFDHLLRDHDLTCSLTYSYNPLMHSLSPRAQGQIAGTCLILRSLLDIRRR